MTEQMPDFDDESTSADRPSSFRELLYRDRRLMSRRQMDRRIRDREAERAVENGDDDDYVTAFPALSRMFSGSTAAEWRALSLVVLLIVASFAFGVWVGSQ